MKQTFKDDDGYGNSIYSTPNSVSQNNQLMAPSYIPPKASVNVITIIIYFIPES